MILSVRCNVWNTAESFVRRAVLPHMRDSRRAELPDGACRMGKVGLVRPGSAASWLASYAGQPPRGTARRGLTNGKRWFFGTRQRAIRRARRSCMGLRGAHEECCALPRCAAAGVTFCTRLPGAYWGAPDVERAEIPTDD